MSSTGEHEHGQSGPSERGEELEPIGVVGVGWVGLVTAACFAEQGHEVWAMDVAADKIASLSACLLYTSPSPRDRS